MNDYWTWWIAAALLVGAELLTGTYYLLAVGLALGIGGLAAWLGATAPAQFAVAAVAFLLIGAYAPAAFLGHFTVFVLACFVGYMVVWNVTPALHTPLMSVTNAISGIIVVGAVLQAPVDNLAVQLLAGVAILLASINVFGGFMVTRRMLNMFQKG